MLAERTRLMWFSESEKCCFAVFRALYGFSINPTILLLELRILLQSFWKLILLLITISGRSLGQHHPLYGVLCNHFPLPSLSLPFLLNIVNLYCFDFLRNYDRNFPDSTVVIKWNKVLVLGPLTHLNVNMHAKSFCQKILGEVMIRHAF